VTIAAAVGITFAIGLVANRLWGVSREDAGLLALEKAGASCSVLRAESFPDGEHPDHAALGHLVLVLRNVSSPRLHPLGVDAPARLHRDVLHTVDGVTSSARR